MHGRTVINSLNAEEGFRAGMPVESGVGPPQSKTLRQAV
jgi:hypothetical protein